MITPNSIKEGPPEYYDNAFSRGTYPNFFQIAGYVMDSLDRFKSGKLCVAEAGVRLPAFKQPFLDIGCGMGRVSLVGYYGHGLRIDGVDFSSYGINLATCYQLKNVTFYQKDVWNFTDYDKYSVFIMTEFLEHIKDDVRFIREKIPSGSLVIISLPSPLFGDTYHLRYAESVSDIVNAYESELNFIEAKVIGTGTYGAIALKK